MDSQPIEKSRSQVKREMHALKDLGIQLADLSEAQLRAVPLSDKTRAAVLAARGMARNALQRHYRYLSSLLEREDVAAIRAALTGALQPHADDVARLHEAERLRAELVSGDENQLDEFVARYPASDRKRLSQLVRSAKQEQDFDRPPRSARLLFRYLRQILDPRD